VGNPWLVTAALAAGTMVLRAAGPLALGGREPPARATAVIALVAPAVLAALVVYQSLSTPHGGMTLDARIVGLAAAGAAIAVRLPVAVVVVLAAAATAAARLLV
jgi:Branched-chain amino acid transport protein (AzlD)